MAQPWVESQRRRRRRRRRRGPAVGGTSVMKIRVECSRKNAELH